jgi:hypothetical protein
MLSVRINQYPWMLTLILTSREKWGSIGLLLATPLTACLVVLGRYFPAFHICSVGDDPQFALSIHFVYETLGLTIERDLLDTQFRRAPKARN